MTDILNLALPYSGLKRFHAKAAGREPVRVKKTRQKIDPRVDRHDGASPSRMASRLIGPTEPSKCKPAARSGCSGRKSFNSDRFAQSIAKVRLITSPRRAES
jgi:hypothetical protein